MTANSFTSVSLSPPLLLFCIGKSRSSYQAFVEGGSFAINVLNAAQRGLSQVFSSTGTDKWAGVEFVPDALGNAALADAVATFLCRKIHMVPAADHMIVLGEVTDLVQRTDLQPLVYCRSQYCSAVELAAGDADQVA